MGDSEPVSIADEVPFDIPDSWEWVRLHSLVSKEIRRGKSPKYSEKPGIQVFAQKCNVKSGGIDMTLAKFLDANTFHKYLQEEHLQDQDIIINSTGNGTLGRIGMFKDADRIDNSVIVPDSHITVIRLLPQLNKLYIFYAINYYQPYLEKLGEGSTNQTELRPAIVADMLIPLPPKSEQLRIVAILEKALPMVKKYDKAAVALAHHNVEFPVCLKKSILQMAVQGKLVPQDSTDEPASVLLDRIREEKQRLIKEGKIKRDKRESAIYRRDNSHYEMVDGVERCIDEEIPFEIPKSWQWARIGALFFLQAGKNIQASEISDMPFDGAVLCYGGNGIRGYVKSPNHEGDYPIIGRQGALCGNIKRATGTFYATEHAVCVETFCNTDVSWACLFLKALNLNQYATATAQPGLAVAKVNTVLIPLPPLAEQRRIVTKIEEILPMLSELKS